MFNSQKIMGILRHVLTILGGYLVGKGIVDEGTMLEIVGALMSIIGVVASVMTKEKSTEAVTVLTDNHVLE